MRYKTLCNAFKTSLIFSALTAYSAAASTSLSLEQAITMALQNDPWLTGNKLRQQAVIAKSVAAASYADPKVSVGVMNLPVDSWVFDQEAMTQLNVGVSQSFPRGNSLLIKQQQLQLTAHKFPLQLEERQANIRVAISALWLDVYLAQKTIQLIENDKVLFEQLIEVTRASYSSAVGKTRQQDVIRAQLELVQLQDKLTVEYQKLDVAHAKLTEWLRPLSSARFGARVTEESDGYVMQGLPNIALSVLAKANATDYERVEILTNHPSVKGITLTQSVAEKDIQLAKQQLSPQWGLSANYAYRDDTPAGVGRSDFFSIGVTFDVPLFTENKQQPQISASIAEAEAIKTDKLLKIQQMLSQIDSYFQQLQRLKQRRTLYRDSILPQVKEQSEASLTAYTHDDGDFAEAIRSRIAELNANIAAVQIAVDELKVISQLNYFYTQSRVNSTQVFGDIK